MAARNFLTARWENLAMVNYEVDPALLEPYLPAGTELDYFSGRAFVSLVGFRFVRTKVFGVTAFPFQNFEEINLRFYVKRVEPDIVKRGVVFIKETVPHRAVAVLANMLYRENYNVAPTRHMWNEGKTSLDVEYAWRPGPDWYHIHIGASIEKIDILQQSLEEFIAEHYYGYTRLSPSSSSEYKVEHPRWQVHTIHQTDVRCDFGKAYGDEFAALTDAIPHSVMLAAGSAISVKWKRSRIIITR